MTTWLNAPIFRMRSLATFAFSVILLAPSTQASDDFSIARIRAAWQKRSESIKSADIIVQVTRTVRAFAPPASGSRRPNPVPVNENGRPVFSTRTFVVHFFIDDDQIRIDNYGRGSNAEPESCILRNGEARDLFVVGGEGPNDGPTGTIQNQGTGAQSAFAEASNWPILFFLRPFYLNQDPLKSFVLTGTPASPDGGSVRLVHHSNQGGIVVRYVLDPAMGFAATQSDTEQNGKLTIQRDIQYMIVPKVGPVPQLWHLVLIESDGTPFLTIEGKTKSAKFNIDIPKSTFDLIFPKGTLVIDERSSLEAVNRHVNSIAIGSNELVPIPNEVFLKLKTRKELLDYASRRSASFSFSWPAAITVTCLLALIGCFVLYYRRH